MSGDPSQSQPSFSAAEIEEARKIVGRHWVKSPPMKEVIPRLQRRAVVSVKIVPATKGKSEYVDVALTEAARAAVAGET